MWTFWLSSFVSDVVGFWFRWTASCTRFWSNSTVSSHVTVCCFLCLHPGSCWERKESLIWKQIPTYFDQNSIFDRCANKDNRITCNHLAVTLAVCLKVMVIFYDDAHGGHLNAPTAETSSILFLLTEERVCRLILLQRILGGFYWDAVGVMLRSISLTLSVCLRVFNYTCRSPARLQIHLNPLPTTRVQAVSFQPPGDFYEALRCSSNECKAREHHLLSLMWFHWCATISWHPQEDPISLHYCGFTFYLLAV